MSFSGRYGTRRKRLPAATGASTAGVARDRPYEVMEFWPVRPATRLVGEQFGLELTAERLKSCRSLRSELRVEDSQVVTGPTIVNDIIKQSPPTPLY
jgi:hypothetical protein